jgi:hypothetical protein
MFSKNLILIILGCLSVVAAVPVADTNDLPYPVAPLRATYQEIPDSEPIMLEGDVHEKVQKLRARAGLSGFSPATLSKIRSELDERTQVCEKDIVLLGLGSNRNYSKLHSAVTPSPNPGNTHGLAVHTQQQLTSQY